MEVALGIFGVIFFVLILLGAVFSDGDYNDYEGY